MDAISIGALYERQLGSWELARNNYSCLQDIKIRTVSFDDCEILVQFNPKRIISSSAKVDPQSVSNRLCFLCSRNRPSQQISIPVGNDYLLLVNPYPVFKQHLTVTSIQHRPQLIRDRFEDMLYFARTFPQLSIIYNGPESGASAPDHFHFQAFQRDVLPVESDFSKRRNCKLQGIINGTEIFTWEHYMRSIISFRGGEINAISRLFHSLYKLSGGIIPGNAEPMMNILACYEQDAWIVHVILRKQHRPLQYYEEGERKLLLSPASIDMGGVLIMAREEDYDKITREDIADIFKQVSVDDEIVRHLVETLKRKS